MKIRKIQETEIKELPQILKRARGAIPRSQIANRVGITRQFLIRLEEGKTDSINYETLKKLESVLGIELSINFSD